MLRQPAATAILDIAFLALDDDSRAQFRDECVTAPWSGTPLAISIDAIEELKF